jgi:hypothetical protein
MSNLLQTLKYTHRAALLFLGGTLAQLVCVGFIIGSSFWAHALLFYAAACLLILPALMLLALIIEAARKSAGRPTRLKLVGVTFFWSLITLLAFLTLLGPIVEPFINNDYIGSAHFNRQLYYINGQPDPAGVLHHYYLYECNYVGFGCRQVAPIAQGAGRDFSLDLLDDRLEISYNGEVVYTLMNEE